MTFAELDGPDWERTGRHPEQGSVTIEDLLDLYAWHGRHHIEQIRGLRTRRGW